MYQAKENEVTVLLLVSGMTVIGRVVSRDEDSVTLINLVSFDYQVQPTANGQLSINIGFGRIEPPVTVNNPSNPRPIKNSHILFEFEPARPLAEKYTESISGIKIASTQETQALNKPGQGLPPGFQIAR